MIEVMGPDGNINCVITVKVNNALIVGSRSREVLDALLELRANGVLTFETRNVRDATDANDLISK